MTSPSCISHIGTSPPSGVKESCIELTEPFDADVVAVAHSAELTMPKRASLPSMLPPGCVTLAAWSTPRPASTGLPRLSAHAQSASRATKTIVIAASTAQPCRVSFTIAPNV